MNNIKKNDVFNPIEVNETTYPTLKLENKNLDDFFTIIQSIETKISDEVIKRSPKQQKLKQNNDTYNYKKTKVDIGLSEDARANIKINDYKGDALINYINKLIQKLNDFIFNINNTIRDNSEKQNSEKQFINEKGNKKLVKQLIELRNKSQPNCNEKKYKTSGLFSSAFATKLTDNLSTIINQQIFKDIEVCFNHIITIIKSYCEQAAIITAETQSYVEFNTKILYNSEEMKNHKKRMEKLKRQLGGTHKKIKSKKIKSKTTKHKKH